MNQRWRVGLGGWGVGIALVLLGACGGKQVTSVGDVPELGDAGESAMASAGKGASQGTGGAGQGGDIATGATGSGGKTAPGLPGDVFADPQPLSKLDLLLMVDNSMNMLEKQRLLMDAVTQLLAPPGGTTLSADDIHVGVITSSLGAHGAASPKDVCVTAEDNDRARFVATMRDGVTTFKDTGFLAWGPDPQASASLEELNSSLEPMLAAVGDHGCGYEGSLEAWRRFLVDPEPYEEVIVPEGTAEAEPQGIDDVLLAQRAEFLRPDSVLAIVMLSDENDCSIVDEGYGWLISRASPMYRSTAACHTDPNDPCCQSCGEQAGNEGCARPSEDAACQTANGAFLDPNAGEDDLNVRCWDQKRRFGFDLLYPIERYTDALTRQWVHDRSLDPVLNPIFAGGQRHPSQVILTGIVGVPWQDLADQASLSGPGLNYLSASQLVQQQRWPLMLGNPQASPPVLPTDPFMIETTLDRAELSSVSEHPLVASQRLIASDSTNPQANIINGHEGSYPSGWSLQHACIFPLQQPKVCDQAALDADVACECFEPDLISNNALCQPPGGGPAEITQYFDGAFPALRQLQVLRELGDSAITASICPKVFDAASPDYGYRPAMTSLAARLERAFNP
jgi:hypothetical protein